MNTTTESCFFSVSPPQFTDMMEEWNEGEKEM